MRTFASQGLQGWLASFKRANLNDRIKFKLKENDLNFLQSLMKAVKEKKLRCVADDGVFSCKKLIFYSKINTLFQKNIITAFFLIYKQICNNLF